MSSNKKKSWTSRLPCLPSKCSSFLPFETQVFCSRPNILTTSVFYNSLAVSPHYILLAQTPLFPSFFTIEEISVTYFKRTENLLIHAILNVNRAKCNKITLSFYDNEPSKNMHFLILLPSLARNSQEPKFKRIFEIPWVLFEKSLILYFDWPKFWIWQSLEKVMNIFCKWHFDNASKEVFWQKKILNFMHGFKSAILPGFRSVKVQTETFLKKDSQNFKNSFYLGFL